MSVPDDSFDGPQADIMSAGKGPPPMSSSQTSGTHPGRASHSPLGVPYTALGASKVSPARSSPLPPGFEAPGEESQIESETERSETSSEIPPNNRPSSSSSVPSGKRFVKRHSKVTKEGVPDFEGKISTRAWMNVNQRVRVSHFMGFELPFEMALG